MNVSVARPLPADSAILEHLPVIAFTVTVVGHVHLVTPQAVERAGLRLADGSYTTWMRSIHPDDRQRIAALWRQSLTTGAAFHEEFRLRLKDGTYRWFSCRTTPILEDDLTLRGFAGAALDVDVQKQTETKLRTVLAAHERVSAREGLYNRLNEELAEAQGLSETIEVMLRAIIPGFADWMSVYLEKRDGEGFEIVAMRHWDERRKATVEALLGTSFATQSSATAEVLRTGKSILLAQYPAELRVHSVQTQYQAQIQELGLRSAIVVPLRRRERVIGAIHVIRGDFPADFNNEDLLLVEELARRITPSIYNAEAYERERHVARLFQEAALPGDLPELAGFEFDAVYEAATTEATVGGDWYDVFRIDDERLLISVGDVAGHGLKAATIMVMMRRSLRAFSITTATPSDLMFLLRTLLMKEYPDVFVTAFIGILWPASGRFEYLSAGHPPPLLRAGGGAIEELNGARRPLLGIASERSMDAAITQLDPGSMLVLFTDGLTEARRDILEGERELRTIVASEELVDSARPAHDIYRRMLPEGSPDDTAVLTIRRPSMATTAAE